MTVLRLWVFMQSVCLLTLAFLVPLGLEAQGLGAAEILEVQFEGNETFPDDSLARAIVTSETECRSWILQVSLLCSLNLDFALRRGELREGEIPRDIERLRIWYQRRGFREVEVGGGLDVQPDGRAVVTFSITEGPPVIMRGITFVGAGGYTDMGLLDELPVNVGDRWSTLALDAMRDTLEWRLKSQGYPYVDILRQTVFPSEDPHRADLTFEFEGGSYATYGDITIEGISNLDESTVLRTLPFRPGDPYRADQLIDAQARLFGLDIVRSASILDCVGGRPECRDLPPTSDTVVPLVVQLQEDQPYRVRSGVGWSNAECFNFEARWTSQNFLGGGRVLQVRGRPSNLLAEQFNDVLCPQSGEGPYTDLTWLAAIDFAQPWVFSTRNTFNASVFTERQTVPDIFIREAVGLQLSLVRTIRPQTPLTLSYRPEFSKLDAADILLCTGFLVCTNEDINDLTSSKRLAPVGLNLTRDLANSLLNPTRGYRLIIDLEHASAGTGSQFRYNRIVSEGTWYSGITESSVLATRFRVGWVGSGGFDGGHPIRRVQEVIHPQKRFYAGGANSVRGFAQSRLGPRVLALNDPVWLLSQNGAGCLPSTLIDLTCDAAPLDAGTFVSRPTGGTRVIEGNVEIRFRLSPDLEGVTFSDFGQVWGTGQSLSPEDLEFTPGFGLRYLSPLGPIRVDLGYNFRSAEPLSVVTSQIAPWNLGYSPEERLTVDGQVIDYVATDEFSVLEPRRPFGGGESRIQLHVSIGQAF